MSPHLGFIATGYSVLDSMMSQGYPSSQLISFVGESQSGKSRIIATSLVKAAMSGYQVLLIDTCNAITGQLLLALVKDLITQERHENIHLVTSESIEWERQRILDIFSRIVIKKVYDIYDILAYLAQLETCPQRPYPYDGIYIDSMHHIIASYHVDGLDKPHNYPSQKVQGTILPLIAQVNLLMKQIAVKYNIRIVTTNAITPPATTSGSSGGANSQGIISHRLANITGGLSSNIDIYDVIVLLSYNKRQSTKQTTIIDAEVMLRPPYFSMHPTHGQIKIS